MIGVIDVGGGLRGIYGAGVFDYCMRNGIQFDYCIGVSAGSANIVSYSAGQEGRNYYYFHDYSFRKEYMSLGNFIRKGSYLDMDYIYSTLYNSDGERPLDFPAVARSNTPLCIVATSARTGKPVYFSKMDIKQDCYDVIKASCSIPIVNRPYFINGEPYYDGGISDPIPIEKAMDAGCERIVVILTKPTDWYRDDRMERIFSRLIQRQYPKVADLISHRNALYRMKLERVKKLVPDGRALILAPKTIYNMGTLTKDQESLQNLYDDALQDAHSIMDFISR